MGMDMDMTMTGGNVSADYSDYEYQVISSQLVLREDLDDTGGTEPDATAVNNFEPLAGIGSLDNNEVAELVHLELYASLEFEDDSGDQNVGTSAEFRGNVGVNLPSSFDAFIDSNSNDPVVQGDLILADDIADENAVVEGATRTEDRILQIFKATGGPPFDDSSGTAGPGGGHDAHIFHAEKNFRDLVGRGPVLDSTDNVSTALRLIVNDTVISTVADLKVYLVWDVAEVSDAGRAFSVPDGM